MKRSKALGARLPFICLYLWRHSGPVTPSENAAFPFKLCAHSGWSRAEPWSTYKQFQRCCFVCRLEPLVMCGLLTCVEQKSSAFPQGWWCNCSDRSGRVGLLGSAAARWPGRRRNKYFGEKEKCIWAGDGFGSISWQHAPVRQLREAHSWSVSAQSFGQAVARQVRPVLWLQMYFVRKVFFTRREVIL